MSNKLRNTLIIALTAMTLGIVLVLPNFAAAGIYNSDDEVTYKEYWIDHSEYTGSCLPDGTPEKPYGNSFYIEPSNKCEKTLAFDIPDDFSNAIKVEIYLDLWRNYDIQSARFKLNDHATVYAPNVGSDWSRTPYVAEIPKSELKVGTNTITFWGERPFHVHDAAFRIYYDDQNPLVPGDGSDVTPPDGKLESIEDDNGVKDPMSGGSLAINGDSLTLTASVTGDVEFVEFHAWYEGYDEDNDGEFRDWHNLGRNNWFPGGTDENPLGGVINHIGTVVPQGGTASVMWDLENVTNQAAVKFKIRVVDSNGNVRDAAGGESAEFKMVRNKAVLAFIIPGFKDAGIHMDGSRPDTAQYDFSLPSTITDFNSVVLVGAYWRNPKFSVNDSNTQLANSGDTWILGERSFNMNSLKSGLNRIIYSYAGSGPGHFIEEPGPMFVVRRSSSGGDNQPPAVSNQSPAPGASDVDTETPLTLNLSDGLFGVDFKTVKLKINGNDVSNKMKLDGVSSNYLLSYLPAQDWDYSSQINVTLDACDLAGNCMDTVSYSFTTQDPDTTPPTISNVVVATRPNGADISWTTDEPATSQIDYGETNQHELGSVDDDALKTEHALEINGLQPDNLYHFQIFSTDNKGNTGKTKDDTFLTDVYPDVSSDDFNACQLDPKWEYIDPIGDTTLSFNGEQAIIEVPGGVIHDWNTGRPPRLMQLANDTDFTIDVKFDNLVNVPIQMQGLLVEESDSTYLYVGFEIITDGTTGLPTLTQFARFIENGSVVKGTRKTITDIANYPIYARISRNGDKWSWYYSSDGQNWTRPALPYTFDMTVLKAGVYAGNTPETSGGSVPANTAVIDYFFNADSPIDPEDGIPNALTLSTNGNGAAAKTPDKEKYACGEEVTISESSDIGWFFDSWSGDIESTNQAETVVMDGPKSITANFAPIPYLLTVNLVNNGVGGDGNKVTKNPDLPTYTYDDVVELTAVPELGWVFKEWSGGLTGTELTKSVTMQQDVTATATFEQEQYTLDLQVVHDGIGEGGTVTATPMQDTYVYGDVVALKAIPEPGWTFDGWTGAVTSSDPETELTIMGNSQVTARFVQDQYELNVTIVNDGIGEGGTVSLSPPKATYLYGDVVALVAEAAPGWTFTGWDGALSGDNPVEVLTIKGDTDVTATFAQDNYELDITIEGSGNVKVEPDKPAYLFGDIVTLTAIPAPNLYFGGWGGDLIGAENPIEITVLGDMQITALFTSNPPPVVSPIPDQTIAINNKVSFNITATDPTNEPLVLTVDGLPAGATFIDNGDGTGSFEWTPSLVDRGDYVLTFIASDSEGVGSATMTISVIGYGVAVPVVAGQ